MDKTKRAGEYPKLVQTWITDEQYQGIMRVAGKTGTISKVVRILIDEALQARLEAAAVKAEVA